MQNCIINPDRAPTVLAARDPRTDTATRYRRARLRAQRREILKAEWLRVSNTAKAIDFDLVQRVSDQILWTRVLLRMVSNEQR